MMVACGVSLAAAALPPAQAQEAPAGPGSERSLADPDAAAFDEALGQWQAEITANEEQVTDSSTSDEDLRQIPQKLEELRENILQQRARLTPRLEDRRERLAKLGPVPADGAPKESDAIAAKRQDLESQIAALDGQLRQSDLLIVRAAQVISRANDARRERFTESLSRPVPNFYSVVIPTALEKIPQQFSRTLDAVGEWISEALGKGIIFFALLLLAPLGVAVLTGRIIRRLTAVQTRVQEEELPSLQDRGVALIKNTLRTCLPIFAGLTVFYLISTSAGLTAPTFDTFLPRALLVTAWAILLASLVRETLLPQDRSMAIVPATDAVARKVATLLWVLIAVWLADKLLELKDLVVFTPYHVAVFRSAVVAALCGLLIASVLWVIQSGPQVRQAALSGWRGWLFSLFAILAGAILLSALLGYQALAHFFSTHAVSTAGVLWIMYLLHLAAESMSSASAISGQAIDDDLDEEEDMGAPSLLTMRIIASLMLDIAILLVGITVLSLLWRFDWVEVKGWIQSAFFGFQFGPIRISLQSVLVALGVFVLGLALTRFAQRWVAGRVFAGRKSVSGLHESIRIGIGYLGFVLAALAGLSYLGVDFSNIAIVAGALSVGIGFGLQSIFNNFVSGLILLAERPIKIGDYIQVGNYEGTVKKISVRSTEIETIHRQSVIIPNATLITDPVSNWMHIDRSCRLDIPVGVDYGTDVEQLRSTLLDVARAHRGVLRHPPPVVHFAGFGDSSLDFELRVFLRDVRNRIGWSSELRFAILEALREANITIPFPQRDVHVLERAPETGS